MKRSLLGFGLAGLFSVAASGQEIQSQGTNKVAAAGASSAAPSKSISQFNKASTFIGSVVKSGGGKEIGKVHDLVFDLEARKLAYAVVSLEQADGKDRMVAVPVRALKPAEGEKYLVLNMSESVLAAAERLQEGSWPGTEIFAVGGAAGSESGSGSSVEGTK